MKYLAALALGSALSAPAFAGGMNTPVQEPVISQPVTYAPAAPNGEWTGLYAGAQLGYGDIDSDVAGLDGNGAIGGVHMGYRHDWGQFVGGIELAHDRSNIDLADGAGDLDHMTTLKLQGGYDLGRTLIYANLGAAHAKVSGVGGSASDNGWLVGVGVDYQLTDTWTLGGELNHSRFNNFDDSGIDVKGTTAQLRASYRF
ncbi:outer membrane protein [Szabonella alba]|uniref:Porin family protein n=1 Tax=Szabonella alba TaxID=2804194 RepID=A0A8K0VDY2_9RHOB|nr:porin family protein [Szabonella alba]MBL4917547.1 porin family protein [Szabonella alba]